MKIVKNKFLITIAAVAVTAASASAQLKVGGVGSSAMFQTATIEAFQEANAAPATGTPCTNKGTAGYYVAKNNGQINDQRGDSNIVPQLGNLSVVWDNATTPSCVFYYLSVDSGVGNRAFFSVPRAQLGVVTPAVAPSSSVISPAFFGNTNPVAIPAAVLSIINNSPFTAAFTDIRPEDALFAEHRTNCGTSTTATPECLGYGTSDPYAGAQIKSAISSTQAQPVAFNIFGTDPITGQAIPAWATVPVGVSPVIFITNRSNTNGLGQVVSGVPTFSGMIYQGSPTLLFSGLNCDSSAFAISGAPNVAVYPIEREPISGTMNTFEFNIMVPLWAPFAPYYLSENYGLFTQEGLLSAPFGMPSIAGNPPVVSYNNWGAIQPATNNPLNGACPAPGVNNGWAGGPQGARMRAIGTGDEVTGVKNTPDSIGYIFFSYGNVSSIAGNSNYGYLTYGEWGGGPGGALIPTDPINPSGTYGASYTSPQGNIVYPGNGQLPTCTAPCPLPAGTSFPNVRSGAYLQWSLLRAAGAPGDLSLLTLANGIANQVNNSSPDFIPFNATTDGDPGIQFYRSHFSPAGVTYGSPGSPNNGINPATGAYVAGTESGGDVGGCVDWRYPPNGPTNLLNCRY
jgi:hypothetical protein